MKTKTDSIAERPVVVYAAPMLVFLGFLAINSALKKVSSAPEYWLYPLQTISSGAVVIWFRREYARHSFLRPIFTIGAAVFAFAIWIAPQTFFGFPPRSVGFNPEHFAGSPLLFWATVLMRFVRLVVVVPLVEEIFWRGFLLRYLIDDNFRAVPFGSFTWLSFAVVTIAFTLSHATPDWPAALLTGMLFNAVAYRTRSLLSCIVAHATTNLLLGFWIMYTRQWGFW